MLSIGILLLGTDGWLSAQASKSAAAKHAAPTSASGRIWKSLTTDREYRVRIEKDRLYAEWVNLPPDFVSHGAYVKSELHRVEAKWVGTSRSKLPCTIGQGAAEHIGNWCPLLSRIEVHSVSSDRITGRGEQLRRYDCQNCKILETVWANFTWVPKEKATAGSGGPGKAPAKN